MIDLHGSLKITLAHRARKAVVYLRQSSLKQVRENVESQRLQYALADRARALGFERVEVVESYLGSAPRWGRRPARVSTAWWRRWLWAR